MPSSHPPHPISSPTRSGAHRLETEQVVAAAIEETFAFFSNAANLDAITPPSLDFTILTPLPIVMREGTLIEYRLRLGGMPIHWLTRIDEWTPERSFTDTQLRGPYALWVHRHRFAPHGDGTLIADRVDYALPLPYLTAPVHALFVRPMIERIFAYRRQVIARVLGSLRAPRRPPGGGARAGRVRHADDRTASLDRPRAPKPRLRTNETEGHP